MQIVMFEASQIENQRLIGSHPFTPEDGTYLCPNDLILERSSTHASQGPFKERELQTNKYSTIFDALCRYFGKSSQLTYFLI